MEKTQFEIKKERVITTIKRRRNFRIAIPIAIIYFYVMLKFLIKSGDETLPLVFAFAVGPVLVTLLACSSKNMFSKFLITITALLNIGVFGYIMLTPADVEIGGILGVIICALYLGICVFVQFKKEEDLDTMM